MNRTTYETWLETTVALFEESEDGARALEWLQNEDFIDAFDDGMTSVQVYDKYVNGWFF